MHNIKLFVKQLPIDPGSTLTHSGTSYQVSESPDFSGALVLDIVNDLVNLLSYTLQYDLQPNQPLYARTRYHFNNGDISNWSNITDINSNQVGIKSSDTIIATPNISVSYDYSRNVGGELVIRLQNVKVYSGPGTIDSVSWDIDTTNGIKIFELPNSKDILSELRLPLKVLGDHKCIIASAVVHSNNNVKSNIARIASVITDLTPMYFNAALHDTFFHTATNFMLVTEHADAYTNMDVRILQSDGTVVETFLGLDLYVPVFDAPALDPAGLYIVEARAQGGAGLVTPWVEIYRGTAYEYTIRDYSTTVDYVTTEFGFGGYIDLEGRSAQSIEADEDNVFYMVIPGTQDIAAYHIGNSNVYPINKKKTLSANYLADMPTFAAIRLFDGNYIFDTSRGNIAGVIESPQFTYISYNHITKEISFDTSRMLLRSDERYGVGRTNSHVATKEGLIYYVPSAMRDANENPLDLELRVYDIATSTIIDNIPLPVTVQENVALAEDKDGNIYMFGGTGPEILNALHGEVANTLLNSDIYKLDKITKTWTNIKTVALSNANSYRYRMQTLRNGTILILDATPNIVGGGTRSSYIYDPVSNTITDTITNNPSEEHNGIMIEAYNGDIAIISSTSDVVESVSFLRTTASARIVANTAIAHTQQVTDLVVAIGDTVYIRDPYRYNSIVIDGTDLGNTGKLVWIRNGVAEEYFYNDLIVTRNMTITGPLSNYNNVVVVGDAVLTIQ